MIDMPASAKTQRVRRVALGHVLHRSARRFGDRMAIVDGDLRLSYAQLDARSSRFAHYLLATLGSGQQIGMLCANSADMVVAYNGIHKSGNVWVPLNFQLDVDTIGYILQHAEVGAIIVDADLLTNDALQTLLAELQLPLIITQATDADNDGAVTLAQAETQGDDTLPDVAIDAEQPALIMYTSGTTGRPKGAVHSHLSVATAALGNAHCFAISEQDVFSCVLPLFHCAQHTLASTAHACGASIVIARGFVPETMRALMLQEKITLFTGVPMMYAALLADPDFRCPDMRLCVYAMAPIPKPLIAQIAERLCDNIMLATGQTEIYPATMTFRPLDHPELEANYWGETLTHNDTAVMDDDGKLLGPGEPGEIVHRGVNVMLGYLKDEAATAAAQRFGWHHTGDLGMWGPGGQMLFLDRKKDMIKTGGENVASLKVEAILLAHPGVAGAAVLGLPHPHWSEAVCAFIVKKTDVDVDETTLLAYCRDNLGRFEVPKLIRFLDELPATATGKVRKNVLREQYADLAADV